MYPHISNAIDLARSPASLHQATGAREGHMLKILHDIGSLALLFFSSTLFYHGSIIAAFIPGAVSVIQGFLLAKTIVNNQDRPNLLDELHTIISPATLIQYLASLFFITATFTGSAAGGMILTGTFMGVGAISYFFADRIFLLIDDRL